MIEASCKICGCGTEPAGCKRGKWKKCTFYLQRCPSCGFAFITNPWTDYEQIYTEEYYDGRGPDPLLDYIFELEHPEDTIREYEWRGIRTAVNSLVRLEPTVNWMDFGCGNGGLVRYCQDSCRMMGFDDGWMRDKAVEHGLAIVDSSGLDALAGQFDVVTAIEVLEHVEDPLRTLRSIRALLKPGGLFFYTTGNARPHRRRLSRWSYVLPEVHISFYEPETLSRALSETGFRPEFRGYLPGHSDILRFKILKNLRQLRRAAWHRVVPWEMVGRAVNAALKVTGHPIGWAV